MELFLRGDQIATYQSLESSGNANGTQVVLSGVQTLGTSSDTFRVVIRQIGNGQTAFQNGQMVDIYPYPDTIPASPPIFSSLNPQHDQYQGRASSDSHNIFSGGRVLFQTEPISNGTVQFGPGNNPPRSEQLAFTTFSPTPPMVPCFTPGTMIATDKGERPVEALVVGDMLRTMDKGDQPIRWIGQRKVEGVGAFAPVRISEGVFGNERATKVSPQHRILVTDARAELWFGSSQVLIAASHLVNGSSITQRAQGAVTYIHIALDEHQIIFADGMASETLLLGPMGIASMDVEQRSELVRLFPELSDPDWSDSAARPCLSRREALLFAA